MSFFNLKDQRSHICLTEFSILSVIPPGNLYVDVELSLLVDESREHEVGNAETHQSRHVVGFPLGRARHVHAALVAQRLVLFMIEEVIFWPGLWFNIANMAQGNV